MQNLMQSTNGMKGELSVYLISKLTYWSNLKSIDSFPISLLREEGEPDVFFVRRLLQDSDSDDSDDESENSSDEDLSL